MSKVQSSLRSKANATMQVNTSMSRNPRKKSTDFSTSDADLSQSPEQHRTEKHEIDDGRNQRQHQLEHENIRQRDPAKRAVFRAQKRVAMLPEGLQGAEGPAESLADELSRLFRGFGPGDGFFVVADAPTETPNRYGQIGVLGDRVCSDPARSFNGFLAPRAERAGHNRNAVQQVERAFLHVLAGDVLEGLPARQPARTVADLHVARNRTDLGIREMANQFADGVRLDFRVRVDGNDNFGVRLGHGHTQSHRFSTIHLVNDADARLARKVRFQKFTGLIRGPVIHNDDAQILRVREENRSHGLHDHTFFVVRGDQDGHARRRVRNHGVIWPELLDQSQQPDDQSAAAYQHDA